MATVWCEILNQVQDDEVSIIAEQTSVIAEQTSVIAGLTRNLYVTEILNRVQDDARTFRMTPHCF